MIRLTPLVIDSHMILAEERGMVYFACDSQPLLSLKTFGPPEKCPVCGAENPLSVKTQLTPGADSSKV